MNSPPSPLHFAPLVSVVVRCFNRIDRIARAIDSALAQTLGDFEILVIDDASTDGSAELVAQRYADTARLRLIRHARNRGAAAAANTGINEARGHYVAFLDSDDSWLPGFLAAHVQALAAQPGKLLSYCDYVQVFDAWHLERPARCGTSTDQRRDFLRGGFIDSQSVTMAVREALVAFGGFNEDYVVSHDYDLWLRMALHVDQPFVHITQPLVRYTMADDGVTTRHDRWLQEYRAAMDEGFRHAAAQPYAQLHAKARGGVALGIVARRQLMHWLQNPAPLSVSVIVRTGDRKALLERALQSIRAQSHAPTQIIVVDNASTDGTAAYLQQLIEQQALAGLEVVRLSQRAGTAAALNAGAAHASGDLIAFLDDDDEWAPQYLLEQARANSMVVKAPVFTYCDYTLVTAHEPPRDVQHAATGETSDVLRHALFNVLPHTLSAFVTRREHFEAAGGADERLQVLDDVSLQLRLLRLPMHNDYPAAIANPPVRIAQPLVRWHRGAGGAYRTRMLALYLEQASLAYGEFFASSTGRHYEHLQAAVLDNFHAQITAAYREHYAMQACDMPT